MEDHLGSEGCISSGATFAPMHEQWRRAKSARATPFSAKAPSEILPRRLCDMQACTVTARASLFSNANSSSRSRAHCLPRCCDHCAGSFCSPHVSAATPQGRRAVAVDRRRQWQSSTSHHCQLFTAISRTNANRARKSTNVVTVALHGATAPSARLRLL